MSQNTCRSCEELLLEFKVNSSCLNSSKLSFELGFKNNKDIYNITAPFSIDNNIWIAGRVEDRTSEDSEIVFFQKSDSIWKANQTLKPLHLQDPFVTRIDNMLILGGVEIYDNPNNPGTLSYRTIFLKGTSLYQLEPFAKGPEGMKDIRLLQLEKNKILVFTRPQGKIGGKGTIGYTLISNLKELTPERICSADLLKDQFYSEEWGGANQLHLLKNGKIGVLSHIAKFDEKGNRHYYSTVFCFDWKTGNYTPMKLIATRKNFIDGPSKRADLKDVIFSGGLVRMKNGQAQLYCGVSDAEGHMITIEDPFLEYEK